MIEKLIEETKEFTESASEEEMADVLEVINAICEFKKFDQAQIEKPVRKKRLSAVALRKK